MSRIVLAAALCMIGTVAQATFDDTPEPLKGPDRSAYEALKELKESVDTPAAKEVLMKQAKYMVGQLTDPKRIQADDLARVIQQAIRDLAVQKAPPKKDDPKQLAYNRAIGEALVKELESTVKHPKIVVRVNAARLLSLVGQTGFDGVVPLALKILADPKESEGVKLYALLTLSNILAYVEDPILPEKSVFLKEHIDWEHQAIQALCDYIMRKPDLAGKTPEEIAALRFIRRDAVRGLGFARAHRVRYQGNVLSRPGLVLLKVANADGIVPEPDMKERAEAVCSFCNLFPVTRANVDRDIQIDYASNQLATALLDIVTAKLNDPADMNIEWVYFANKWEYMLNLYQKNVNDIRLDGAATAKTLYDRAKTDLLEALKANQPSMSPDAANFRAWLKANPPKSKSLYKDEAAATVNLKAGT